MQIRILPSTSKKMKKNLDFHCSFTSLWTFYLSKLMKMYLQGIRITKFFVGIFKSLTKRAGSGAGSASGSLVKNTDPQPDPYQNVTDPEHYSRQKKYQSKLKFHSNSSFENTAQFLK
jgi:hypothetical protein